MGSAGSASSIGTHEFLIIDEQIRLQTLAWMVVMLAPWICMAARTRGARVQVDSTQQEAKRGGPLLVRGFGQGQQALGHHPNPRRSYWILGRFATHRCARLRSRARGPTVEANNAISSRSLACQQDGGTSHTSHIGESSAGAPRWGKSASMRTTRAPLRSCHHLRRPPTP